LIFLTFQGSLERTQNILKNQLKNKGFAFYFDGYVFNQEVGKKGDCVLVRTRCYRSMKKSETVFLSATCVVTGGNCSCVAGAGDTVSTYTPCYIQ
jgi:hypothetical protein